MLYPDESTRTLIELLALDEQALIQAAEELEERQHVLEQLTKQMEALKHAIAVRA